MKWFSKHPQSVLTTDEPTAIQMAQFWERARTGKINAGNFGRFLDNPELFSVSRGQIPISKAVEILGPKFVVTLEQASSEWKKPLIVSSGESVGYSERFLEECKQANTADTAKWRLCWLFGLTIEKYFQLMYATKQIESHDQFGRALKVWMETKRVRLSERPLPVGFHLINFAVAGYFDQPSSTHQKNCLELKPSQCPAALATVIEAVKVFYMVHQEKLLSDGFHFQPGSFFETSWVIGKFVRGGFVFDKFNPQKHSPLGLVTVMT